MIKRELYKVKEGIDKCSDLANASDINFAMTLAEIDYEVSNQLRIIDAGKKTLSDDYKAYIKEKKKLDMDYAIQKEDGSLQSIRGELLIRNPKEYYKKLEILQDKYKDEIKAVEVIQKEFETYLDNACTKEIPKLPKSLLPKEMTVEQVKLLFPIIDRNK